jgi:heterodisulfide reductase subunit C
MKQEIIALKEINEKLLKELKKVGVANIVFCIQCGTCSASCPSGMVTALRTRQLIRKAMLGLSDVLKSDDLWLCTTCYTCLERCPRKIETVPAIIALRNLAVESGFINPRHREVAETFIRYGHAVPINDENIKKRRSLGLAPVPPTVQFSKEALEELQKLIKKSGFDKKVGSVLEGEP